MLGPQECSQLQFVAANVVFACFSKTHWLRLGKPHQSHAQRAPRLQQSEEGYSARTCSSRHALAVVGKLILCQRHWYILVPQTLEVQSAKSAWCWFNRHKRFRCNQFLARIAQGRKRGLKLVFSWQLGFPKMQNTFSRVQVHIVHVCCSQHTAAGLKSSGQEV